MKLTFKDLKQQKFVIEAEPTELISDVKEKITKEKGWEASQQKLIYSGKILQDTNTVEFYKIEEKGFIVCMVSKPKAAPAASSSKTPSTPAPAASSSTPAPPAAPQQAASAPTAVPATPSPAGNNASTIATPATPAPAAGAGPNIASERAQQIAELVSMGFEQSQCEAALRAAYYNADRAVEYLFDGIPEHLQRAPAAAAAPVAEAPSSPLAAGGTDAAEGGAVEGDLFQQAAQAAAAGGAGRGARAAPGAGLDAGGLFGAAAAGGAGLGNLDFLRNNPQFQQLRQVVQQQPQMLEPILQQVGAGNPQLAALIGQHPEQFLQLLSEDAGDDAPLPPGASQHQIQVTEEEREAIERLCRLGFPRDQAIQAYFACDKNEELAANFLFDQPEEDDAA